MTPQQQDTKRRVLATIQAAIHAPAPGLISFRHTSTLLDPETKYSRHMFSLNGVPFRTGWYDAEYYGFLDATLPETSALTTQELHLLVWWLENDDTVVDAEAPAPRQYLG
jgi:hypothetical protein